MKSVTSMYNLGIDIGGTKCAAVLGINDVTVPKEKLIIDKLSFPTNVSRGWKEVMDELISTAQLLLKRNGVTDLHAIGISCGGPLDSKKGIVCRPPNLPDWDSVPVKQMFESAFNTEARLQNDANACAVAEWKLGAGRGFDSLIFLTFGTGMGAGLILDGRLYSGACDMAGEVGHIRLADDGPEGYGKRGSFEGFCSGGGISRLASHLSDGNVTLSAKELAIAAHDGDSFAKQVYEQSAEKLGLGLSILIDILNPQAIIIGSIYERSRDLFESTIKSVIEREALSYSAKCCKILPAALGDSLGDLAALSLAMN